MKMPFNFFGYLMYIKPISLDPIQFNLIAFFLGLENKYHCFWPFCLISESVLPLLPLRVHYNIGLEWWSQWQQNKLIIIYVALVIFTASNMMPITLSFVSLDCAKHSFSGYNWMSIKYYVYLEEIGLRCLVRSRDVLLSKGFSELCWSV
jgi:hypothetical protein